MVLSSITPSSFAPVRSAPVRSAPVKSAPLKSEKDKSENLREDPLNETPERFLSDRIIFLSKPPSRVILDTRVDIRRPRNLDNKEIEIYRKNILKKTQDFLKEK